MRDFLKGTAKFLGVVAIILLAIGGVLYGFFVRVVTIQHNGMAPTIIAGDQILIWRGNSFDLGEAVLCPHPEIPGRHVLARVVARPGQHVGMARGSLTINGQTPDVDLHAAVDFDDSETGRRVRMVWGEEDILDHDHLIFYRERGSPPVYRERIVSGGYFLLSDNRSYRGEDSRSFGVVNPETCLGSVFMRVSAAPSPPEINNRDLEFIE